MNKRLARQVKNLSIFLVLALCSLILIIYSAAAAKGVKNGLLICSSVLIPSLFPFTLLSIFALKSGIIYLIGEKLSFITRKLFKLNGLEFSVFVLALLGGYPIGAKLLNELSLDGKIEAKRARKLLYCSINAGPSFIYYTVGCFVLNSKFLGAVLFISNFLTSIIFMLILFRKKDFDLGENYVSAPEYYLSDCLVMSVEKTCKMFLNICGWVIAFSSLAEIVSEMSGSLVLENFAKLFLEISVSITAAPKIGVASYFYSFFISFGGFSVICQIKSAAKNITPSFLKITLNRLLHGGISSAFTYSLLNLFPRYAETFSNNVVTVFNGFEWNFGALFLMVLAVFFIIYVKQ